MFRRIIISALDLVRVNEYAFVVGEKKRLETTVAR
jgi:hypothetical protein